MFPAAASFSFNNSGQANYKEAGAMKVIVPNPPHYNSKAASELDQEAVLPHGESGVVTQLNDKTLIWTIVRSPALQQKDHYWSECALTDAFENYFTNEYKNEKSVIEIGGKNVYRPNHNLTHTYRVMTAIEMVVQYFSYFAKDEDFKEFCQTITAEEIEWLRVAAAFSITGRECEVSAKDNLQLYESYREASQDHFKEFVAKTAPESSEEMQQRMSHVVRYMGNPRYMFAKNEGQINNIEDIQELDKRNYYFTILTIAHKLDLPRCYSKDQFYDSMAFCRELSIENTAQQRAYNSMVLYQVQHIKAHGGRLCDIDATGNMSNVNTNFTDEYAESSLSIPGLMVMSATVTRPNFSYGQDHQTCSQSRSNQLKMRV